MSAPPPVEYRGLSKIFDQIPVVDRIDIAVAQSEIVMMVGPSGAGKSTLLRCINRIEIPSERGNSGGWGQTGWREPQR
jgi:ABC-type polar amino acid transport system ATPase subunit